MGNFTSPIHLLPCFWQVGGNWGTWRKPIRPHREHVIPELRIEPQHQGPWYLSFVFNCIPCFSFPMKIFYTTGYYSMVLCGRWNICIMQCNKNDYTAMTSVYLGSEEVQEDRPEGSRDQEKEVIVVANHNPRVK